MVGRSYSSNSYRFGFNGKEKNNEITAGGNSLDFGSRIYDPRLARWLSIDPLYKKYSYLSPYCFVGNNPIKFVDKDGKDFGVYVVGNEIIIRACYFTDNNENTEKYVKEALGYINSQSGKYKVVGTDGVEYNVKFELTLANKEGETNEQRQTAAENDAESNYIQTTGDFPIGPLVITQTSVGGDEGQTLLGGDNTTVTDWTEVTVPVQKNYGVTDPSEKSKTTTIHEILHTLGVSHGSMGKNGFKINETVIGSILSYAKNKTDNFDLKLLGGGRKGNKEMFYSSLFGANITAEDMPKVTVYGGSQDQAKVTVSGTVKKVEEKKTK